MPGPDHFDAVQDARAEWQSLYGEPLPHTIHIDCFCPWCRKDRAMQAQRELVERSLHITHGEYPPHRLQPSRQPYGQTTGTTTPVSPNPAGVTEKPSPAPLSSSRAGEGTRTV